MANVHLSLPEDHDGPISSSHTAFLTGLQLEGAVTPAMLSPKGEEKTRVSLESVGRTGSQTALDREKVMTYMETSQGAVVKHKLDFNSPRTLQAAEELGFTLEDCQRKYVFVVRHRAGRSRSLRPLESTNESSVSAISTTVCELTRC
jgi:hypothetical protein